jgi:protein TonB
VSAAAQALSVTLPTIGRSPPPESRASIAAAARGRPAGVASLDARRIDELPPGGVGRTFWIVAAAVVVGLHALASGVRIGASEPVAAPRNEVTVELVRPVIIPPQKEPEPPKPKPEPPKVVKKPAPARTPPPALRTPVASEVIPQDAIVIEENTTAAVTSEPVVAAPPAPPAPEPAKEEPVTEPNAFAAYLSNPPPDYPAFAQRQGWEGKVVLRVRVLASGKASTIEVKASSGRKSLDEAAINAVRGWTFVPSKRGSTPIDGWATVPIEFKLSS